MKNVKTVSHTGRDTVCDKLEDYQLLKSGAINFACELIKKIEILNNKYSKLNNDAQSLKNRITNL